MTTLKFQEILDLVNDLGYEAAQSPDSAYAKNLLAQLAEIARQLVNDGYIKEEELQAILTGEDPKEKILSLRELVIKGAIAQEKQSDPQNLQSTLEKNIAAMEDSALEKLIKEGTPKEKAQEILKILSKYQKLSHVQRADVLKEITDHPLEAIKIVAKNESVYEASKLIPIINSIPVENTRMAVATNLGSKNELLINTVTAYKILNPEANSKQIEQFILEIQATVEAEGQLVKYEQKGLEEISKFKIATGDSELVVQTFTTQLLKSNPEISYKEADTVSRKLQENNVHEFAAQVQYQINQTSFRKNITDDQITASSEVYRVALEHHLPQSFKFDLKKFNFRSIIQSQRIAFNNTQLIVPIKVQPPVRLFYDYIEKFGNLNPVVQEAASFVFERMGLSPLTGTASQQIYKRAGGRIAARIAQSTVGKAAIKGGTRILLRTVGKETTKKILQAIGGSVSGGTLAVVIEIADKVWSFVSNLPIVKDVISAAKQLFKKGINGAMIVVGGGAAAVAAALGGGVAAIVGAGVVGAGGTALAQGVFTGTGAAVGTLQGVGAFVGSVSSMLVEVAVVSIATPIIVTIIATPIVVALLLFIINSSAYVLPKSLNYTIDMSSIVPLGNGMDFPHCFPVRGVITQGPKGPSCSSHCSGEELNANAIDIGASGIDRILPVPVRATHNGTVTKTGYDYTGYGKHVVIESKDGTFSTIYGHLDTILVSSGPVQAGTTIGFMGNTGQSTGKHLHYGLKSISHASILGSVPNIQLNANISDTDLNSCYANNK